MGKIIGSRMASDQKVIFEVELDYDEALELRGHTKGVHLFSEESAHIKTNVSGRGKNEATKYFLIPKELRKELPMESDCKCLKVRTNTKTIFVYLMDNVNI